METKRPRRARLGAGLLVGALAAGPLWAAAASSALAVDPTVKIGLLTTSDEHSNILNWDYYTGREQGDVGGTKPHVGLAGVQTLIDTERATNTDWEDDLLVSAGDQIQGTPLGTYYAQQEPITGLPGEAGAVVHPMATTYATMGYDFMAIGNHEFNYDLPILDIYLDQLAAMDVPAVSGNTFTAGTDTLPYGNRVDPGMTDKPYKIQEITTSEGPLKVGFLGLTTPGVSIWDAAFVNGKLDFKDLETEARKWVPEVKAAGADIIITVMHSGDDGTSSYDPTAAPLENAAEDVAKIADVDVVVFGHSHKTQTRIVDNEDGTKTFMTQPGNWGQYLGSATLMVDKTATGWEFDGEATFDPGADPAVGQNIPNTVADATLVTAAINDEHEAVKAWVASEVGYAAVDMFNHESRYRDTPALDWINKVQEDAVKEGINNDPNLKAALGDLPVISLAAPFSRTGGIPQGPFTIGDIASLYTFDNTLMAKLLDGRGIKEYLEYDAEYYQQLGPDDVPDPGDNFDDDSKRPDGGNLTNASTGAHPDGRPDYLIDVFTGITYEIEVTNPVGDRVRNLEYNGEPVQDGDEFVVAVNNYRGGPGNFPVLGDAPLAWDSAGIQVRDYMIADAEQYPDASNPLDPANFAGINWRLTQNGVPIYDPFDAEVPEVPELPDTGANTNAIVLAALVVTAGGVGLTVFTRRKVMS